MSKDVVDEVVKNFQSQFSDFPVVKRLDCVKFGYTPNIIDCSHNVKGVFVAHIVDDSNFVPNTDYLRNHIASGSPAGRGVYDFPDGRDNGFTPKLRGLGFDPAEADLAAQVVVDEANKKVSDAKLAKEKADKDSRNQKILDNLSQLSDSSDSVGSPTE